MGIGCPNALSQRQHERSLPVLNMIVLGFPGAGKSTLIERLGAEREERETQDCSVERVQLEIGSFVLEKRVRIVAFEAPSSAVKTWRYYYVNAHILLFLVDHQHLNKKGSAHAEAVVSVLREIDQSAPTSCQLIVVFSKCEPGEGRRGEGHAAILKALEQFSHEAVTISYSAVSGEGLEKISHSALAFHKNIHI